MAWVQSNENPLSNRVGDCAVRAVAKAMGVDWDTAYIGLCLQAYMMKALPNCNAVWGRYLINKGFCRRLVPDSCPDCYTLADFCADHPSGIYIVAFGSHVVAVQDGDWYDTWDSGGEIPIYYFTREE